MSRRAQERLLRIELLRARAEMERAELTQALRGAARPSPIARGVLEAVGAAAMRRRSLRDLVGLFDAHPWLAGALLSALGRRGVRRALLFAAAAAAVGVVLLAPRDGTDKPAA